MDNRDDSYKRSLNEYEFERKPPELYWCSLVCRSPGVMQELIQLSKRNYTNGTHVNFWLVVMSFRTFSRVSGIAQFRFDLQLTISQSSVTLVKEA